MIIKYLIFQFQTEQSTSNKAYTDIHFLHIDGPAAMNGNLNMNNNKLVNLATPTSNSDAATKKYADDKKVDLSHYLKRDGTKKWKEL